MRDFSSRLDRLEQAEASRAEEEQKAAAQPQQNQMFDQQPLMLTAPPGYSGYVPPMPGAAAGGYMPQQQAPQMFPQSGSGVLYG